MERDNLQAALKQLLTIATANGFVTFDDIMKCADDNSLSLGEFDWLAEAAGSRNVIIYDEAPTRSKSEDDEYDDYAQVDYDHTFAEAIAISPELEPLIDEIRNIVPPQRGEVRRLKYQVQEGNAHARQRMADMYLRIAVRIAVSRAKTYDVDLVDTVGDAFMGLLTAIDRYDPDHSGPFISFASLWIYQNISREQSTRNPCIYFPVHRKEWFYTMYPLLKARGCTECDDVLKCNKVVDMICEKVQCNREQAADVLTASLPNLSWEDIIEGKIDYSEPSYLDESVIEDIEGRDRSSVVREILDKLTPRERMVLIDRYGLDDGEEKTLEQVGQKLGVTRERVRQIEAKAFRKLRHPSRSKKLKEFLN